MSAIRLAALCGIAGAAAGGSAMALDPQTLSQSDRQALQERLADAGCYAGAVDGASVPETEAALKRCPPMDPILRIETGMHTSAIRRVDADRECRLMVTGGDDKTARLWSVADARLQKTLRVPIGPGDDGKVYAVAISPDGKLVAAGGADPRFALEKRHSAYLFDTATGKLAMRLGNFESAILHLTFSPDGRYLAATLGRGNGVRVIDVARREEVGADRNYNDHSYGAAFGPDGRLYTTSDDGAVRAYDRDFHLVAKVNARSSKKPFGIAVDPKGQHVAVGFSDAPVIDIYKAADLGFEYAASRGKGQGYLSSVAWSQDGRRVVAAGEYQSLGNDRVWRHPVVTWDEAGRGARREQPVSQNSILQVVPCGNGFVLGASDPLLAVLDRDGRARLSKTGVIADMRDKGRGGLQIAPDGGRVRFGLATGATKPVMFDLARALLRDSPSAPGLVSPRTSGLRVTDAVNSMAPKFAGQPIKLDPYEMSRALAITPDQSRFLLGTEWGLRAYDAHGQPVWRRDVPEATWALDITADSRRVVAAYGDGTIRWHRVADGEELLALFVDKDDRRWVAWTPSGYYMASPGAEDLIGWHVNRGWDQAADFFPASRFRERFSRPDVVQRVLETLDEAKAVEEANRAANIRTDSKTVAARLPPVVTVLSPRDGDPLKQNEITVEYEVRSPSGLPVDAVEVLIDGRPTRGLKPPAMAAGSGAHTDRQTVTLPSRDVELGLVARSGSLASTVATVRLKWAAAAPAPSADDLIKPKLYGVIVGVSAYRDPAMNLLYAAKDARDFATALMAQKGGLYRDVELRVLTDAEASTAEVKRALTWLERSVTSRDVGIVFLSGHGQVDTKNRFYFLTNDTQADDLEDTAVDGLTLRERSRSVAGKMLVFLDTCYAGRAMTTTRSRGPADINAIVNELSSTENGIVTYASSTGREMSQENESWGNGAFTKALLEGLGLTGAARADLAGKGVITTAALDFWLSERVKELTDGSQHPVMIRPATVPDFPMFTVKR